jgi:hypothetical protein
MIESHRPQRTLPAAMQAEQRFMVAKRDGETVKSPLQTEHFESAEPFHRFDPWARQAAQATRPDAPGAHSVSTPQHAQGARPAAMQAGQRITVLDSGTSNSREQTTHTRCPINISSDCVIVAPAATLHSRLGQILHKGSRISLPTFESRNRGESLTPKSSVSHTNP